MLTRYRGRMLACFEGRFDVARQQEVGTIGSTLQRHDEALVRFIRSFVRYIAEGAPRTQTARMKPKHTIE